MAQTDYRIAKVSGGILFNFNLAAGSGGVGAGVGMNPTIEDMRVSILADRTDYRASGLSSTYAVGFSPRSFTIRGALIHDDTYFNMWRLSSIGANKHVVKIYLGSNWFVYGLMADLTFRRLENRPNVWEYQALFQCDDPWIYYAATGGTPGNDTAIVPAVQVMSSSNIDIDLEIANIENRSFTYLEPFFILEGGSTTSVSTSQNVTFTDQEGRRATFTPPVTWENNVDFVICPYYFLENVEGYTPQIGVAYQIVNGAITPATEWVLDEDCYDNTIFTHASNSLVKDFVSLDTLDDAANDIKPRHFHNYPRAIEYLPGGPGGENRITVASTGTIGDATITAQYLHRRL